MENNFRWNRHALDIPKIKCLRCGFQFEFGERIKSLECPRCHIKEDLVAELVHVSGYI